MESKGYCFGSANVQIRNDTNMAQNKIETQHHSYMSDGKLRQCPRYARAPLPQTPSPKLFHWYRRLTSIYVLCSILYSDGPTFALGSRTDN